MVDSLEIEWFIFWMKSALFFLIFTVFTAISKSQTAADISILSKAPAKIVEVDAGDLVFNATTKCTLSVDALGISIPIYYKNQTDQKAGYSYLPIPIIGTEEMRKNVDDLVGENTTNLNAQHDVHFTVQLDHPFVRSAIAQAFEQKFGEQTKEGSFEIASGIVAFQLLATVAGVQQIACAAPEANQFMGGAAFPLGAFPSAVDCVIRGTIGQLKDYSQRPNVALIVQFGAFQVKKNSLSVLIQDFKTSKDFNQIDSDAGLTNETTVITTTSRSGGGFNLGVISGGSRHDSTETSGNQRIKRWVSRNQILDALWDYSQHVDITIWSEFDDSKGDVAVQRERIFTLMSAYILPGLDTIACSIKKEDEKTWKLIAAGNPDFVDGGKITGIDYQGSTKAKEAYGSKFNGEADIAGLIKVKAEEDKSASWDDQNDIKFKVGLDGVPIPLSVNLYQVSSSSLEGKIKATSTIYLPTKKSFVRTVMAPQKMVLRDGAIFASQRPATVAGEDFDKVPVGTVIASAIPWELWLKFHPIAGANWLPADGREAPAGSAFADLITHHFSTIATEFPLFHASSPGKDKVAFVPDCRGVFLRGLNAFDTTRPLSESELGSRGDPNGSDRTVGSWQRDIFKRHNHQIIGRDDADSGFGHTVSTMNETGPRNDSKTEFEGAEETRPRNISLYFYIKIN